MERRNRNTDMLSGLPDEILCHILSFLSTRGSLQTSVLAKRWRFLWAHVPNFNFYGNRLDKINRVMMLHEAKTVDTFRLYDVNCCEFQLGTLIIYTIRRGVRNVYLHFDFNDEYDSVYTLPGLLLTCKTLVDLTLVSCGVIPSSSGELFLPNLKKLSLNYVLYEDDNSLRHLLSGCPVLEELTVHDCFREGQKNSGDVFVSSPTLKTLNVEMSPGGEDNHDEMLIIDVPSLVYLKVNCSCGLDCVKSSSKIMASLIEVDITINGDLHTSDIMQSRSNEFISFLCQVRHLKISSDFGEMVDNITGNSSMAKFVNLTKLELNLTVDWYILVEFLEGSDNLEVLTFSLDEIFPYKEPERVPPFMLSRLRTVHLTYSNACEVVFDTVRYILRNAQVLERMEISPCSRSSDTEKLDALQRITLFERVSKACQVAFNTRL